MNSFRNHRNFFIDNDISKNCVTDSTLLKSCFKIKIVNEDDHSIRFQVGSKKHWLEPNGEWEIDIDPTDEKMKYFDAWFQSIQNRPDRHKIFEGESVKYMVRKDDGIYKANFDGSNEICLTKFSLEGILELRMERLRCVNAYKIKIINECDRNTLIEIDGKKKWIDSKKDFELIIDSSTSGICKAWLGKIDEDPHEFSIWAEKDAKFMIRKDDGIYKADFDDSNEECLIKFVEEELYSQSFDKLKCLSACKVIFKNFFIDQILFEIDGRKHRLTSKDAFDVDVGDGVTEFCKVNFNGIMGEPMEFIVIEPSNFEILEENGIRTLEASILDKETFIVICIVAEKNRGFDRATAIQSMNDFTTDAPTQSDGTDIDSVAEDNQDILIDHRESKQFVFQAGKDGVLNKYLGRLTTKRKFENNDTYEEMTPSKTSKVISGTDFYFNNMSM